MFSAQEESKAIPELNSEDISKTLNADLENVLERQRGNKGIKARCILDDRTAKAHGLKKQGEDCTIFVLHKQRGIKPYISQNTTLNLLDTNEKNWRYYLTISPSRIYVKVPRTIGKIFHNPELKSEIFSAQHCRKTILEDIKDSRNKQELWKLFGLEENSSVLSALDKFLFRSKEYENILRVTLNNEALYSAFKDTAKLQGLKYSYIRGKLKGEQFCVEIHSIGIENLRSLLTNAVGSPVNEDAFDQENESNSQSISEDVLVRKIIEEKPAYPLQKEDEKSYRILRSAAMSKPVNEDVRDQDSNNNYEIFFADADSVTPISSGFADDVSEESLALLRSSAGRSVNEGVRDSYDEHSAIIFFEESD